MADGIGVMPAYGGQAQRWRPGRPMVAAVIAALLVGLDIGALLHKQVSREARPPVRVRLYASLEVKDFRDAHSLAIYARGVAAEFEGRFARSHLLPRDVQVTSRPTGCFMGLGCNDRVEWTFEVRTKGHIDARVARVAFGRGELTVRSVIGPPIVPCPDIADGNRGVGESVPFVPMAVHERACEDLGPVLHQLGGATAQPDFAPSPGEQVARVTLSAADAAWISDWSSRNPNARLVLMLHHWIVGRIDLADVRATNRPPSIASVGLPDSMTMAIVAAVSAGPPLLGDQPSP